MNAPSFSSLRLNLHRLKEKAALEALKTGTEIEDMTFEEIAFLRELSRGIVPLYVKIGGPEARNDIRELLHLQVDALIAPMIESVYALQKFIQSLQELLPAEAYENMRKGINIETISALDKLDEILAEVHAKGIDQVTAARSDLAASMETGVETGTGAENSADDRRVMEGCALIVKKTQAYGIQTSVGGQVDPANIANILRQIRPDFVNSRHMLLCSQALQKDPGCKPLEIMVQNLEFECALYSHLSEIFSAKKAYYAERISTIKERSRKGSREAVSADLFTT